MLVIMRMRSVKSRATLWVCVVWLGVMLPGCLCAQSGPPYPPSPVIEGVKWDFHGLIRLANTRTLGGSDLWPCTWASDGNVYTGWGDGGGFDGPGDSIGRVSVGFARIIDLPPHITGKNVWGNYPKYAEHPATFCGKPYSMLSVGGVLYAWISSWYSGGGAGNYVPCPPQPKTPEHRLAWSHDLGATWESSHWKLTQDPGQLTYELGGFLNFGENYGGARDQYVYQNARIDGDDNDTYLTRILPKYLEDDPNVAGNYEYYTGRGPSWSADPSKARPVFVDRNGRKITHAVYDSALHRYLAVAQGRTVGETGLFDAPEPWGPWGTVGYYDNWGGFGARESLGVDLPTKWIGDNGLNLWAVFSGGRLDRHDDILDSFNLVKGVLTLKGTGPR